MNSAPTTPPHAGSLPAGKPDQFALLGQRRFAPFFWTQFLGAANDNVFKFAFTILVTYQVAVSWLPVSLAGLVIGAVFILPFVLFSATAGQLADKLEKSALMRWVKNLEIAIMLLATVGLLQGQIAVLLACIFLMGLHSTLFGPAKFSYLPQHLGSHEIVGGSGMVEMGTFVSILLGNVAGGLLIALPEGHVLSGVQAVAITCLAIAVLGRLAAQFIPDTPATAPALQINWNPWSETRANLRIAGENRTVFRALLGISWMWFFGAVFLSQFPSFAKEVLHGDERVASLLLVVFSVGVGVGSLLCETFSKGRDGLALVVLGALGMSVFSADLFLASRALQDVPLQGLSTFLAQPVHWRVLFDLFALSLAAGLYSVPLYALIQLRSQPSHRARIVAANNILNALYMIVSSLLVGALLSNGLSTPQIFGLLAVVNVVVVLLTFKGEPALLAALPGR